MIEVLFIILAVCYMVVSAKVDEWVTISALGFRMETPALFIRNPKPYDIVRMVLFLGALAMCFGLQVVSWYVGVIILAVLWLVAGSIGRKKAFAKYRQVMNRMLEFAETHEEREQIEASISKTDEELADLVRSRMKMGL